MSHFTRGGTTAMAAAGADVSGGHGIGFPRLYDLLLAVLTRGRERAYRRDLLDLAGIATGAAVLDIGCGTGTLAVAGWHRAQPGGSVIGVDISDSMLAAARAKAQRSGATIPFRHADACALPFDDDSFDIVTVTTVLHMLGDARQEQCLAEAKRVLRAGGRLLLIDYAGPLAERRWSARHGPHGRFDLDRMRQPFIDMGMEQVRSGPLRWASLHFLTGMKG